MRCPEEPEGKTLGIVGAGAIGSEVAKYAKTLGFRVIGVKRRAVPLEHYDRVYSNQDLDLALGQMDFVVILTPLTQETRGLFDAGVSPPASRARTSSISPGVRWWRPPP